MKPLDKDRAPLPSCADCANKGCSYEMWYTCHNSGKRFYVKKEDDPGGENELQCANLPVCVL